MKLEPFARHRLHLDGAADLVDVGPHHVHADTTAGDVGDLRRGREARREDELVDLRFRHLLEFDFGHDAVRERLRLDRLGVQPAAVVGDADDDVAAFVIGRKTDGAGLRLAGGGTRVRHLEAVVGRVAHHVRQRILDQVEHLAVQLGVCAVHLQLDLLVEFAGQVTDDARQLLPGIADRLHARLHDAFLQLGSDVRQALQRHLEFRILVPPADLEQLVAGQHQLRDHRHQVLERVDIDADRLIRDLVGITDGRVHLHHRFLGRGLGGGFRCCRRRFSGCRCGRRCRRHFRGCLAECALKLVERDFAWPQRALKRLVDKRALSCRDCGRQSGRCFRRMLGLQHHAFQPVDQVPVAAFRLGFVLLELGQDFLQAIDRQQDERDGFARHRLAVTKLAHQRLGGMRKRLEARQAEETTGTFDSVNKAEDVIENLRVVWILLELHQLNVDEIKALVGFGEEFAKKIIHRLGPRDRRKYRRRGLPKSGQSVGKAFTFG